MARKKRVFYAFPGSPPSAKEAITNGINLLKAHPRLKRDGVRFTPWTEMNIGGKRLAAKVLEDVDRADVFAADVTYPNFSVAFELGYAISRLKRVWLSLDNSVADSEQQYRRVFFGLIGAAYRMYTNSNELSRSFLDDMPLSSLHDTLLGHHYRNPHRLLETPTLVYLKPALNTEAVITCMESLDHLAFGQVIIDDPNETLQPPLEWYATNISSADAVLIHLLSNDQVGYLEHNVKCSLIAGISRGFDKPTLMVVKEPFHSPIDYADLLRMHVTAAECRQSIIRWSSDITATLPLLRRRHSDDQSQPSAEVDLRGLSIGEPVAENERNKLDSYFLPTSVYLRSLEDPVTIVVGRKGVGKSAQLYAMEAALAADRRNHVCVIKPVGYEIDGLVRVLQSVVDNSERGYLVESLWKFLIYSELARTVYRAITTRPPYQPPTTEERALVQHYEEHLDLLDPPFSERLDLTISSLADIGTIKDAVNQRHRISELLHSRQLRDLRQLLGATLTNRDKVSILIDNLDAPWGTTTNVATLAPLLWGLLRVTDDIVSDFRIQDHWRQQVSVHLTIFLRSDIFAAIQPHANEQDKLPIQRIIWNDGEVLKRLIDLRLEFGAPNGSRAADVWSLLFPPEVAGLPTWDFVLNNVLYRPRDVVYLMRQAIDSAISRGHTVVTQQDFLDARATYSDHVFKSILAEDDPQRGKLESIVYEFAGCSKVVTRSEIEKRFNAAGVSPSDFEFYIDLLCDVNFFGIQHNEDYVYASHESDREVKRRIAIQIAKSKESEESYGVSSAFWHVLQTK